MDTLKKILIVCFILISLVWPANAAEQKPNILFILTDDQRWDAIGTYSKNAVRTPNLDRLIQQGVSLDNFFASAPLCCPSRSIFLTGLYPHQTGNYANTGPFHLKARTIADYLNDAGYLTALIGKTHLDGNTREWGFRMTPLKFAGGNIGESKEIIIGGKKQKITGDITALLVDSANQFMEQHQKDAWFLWFATTTPHWPWTKDPKYSYNPAGVQALSGWPSSEKFKPEDWTGYYANVTMMDEQIGRLLRKLDELGLSDNTFVFFTSDNGLMNHSHGIRGKSVWFDESIRVPAVIRWPGRLKANSKSAAFCSSIDFVPTILEVAGIKQSSELPGSSCLPAVVSGRPSYSPVFSEVATVEPQGYWRMIRTDRWKYVQSTAGNINDFHLYDMTNDRFEQQDLARSTKYATVLKNLKNQLEQWLAKTSPVVAYQPKQQDSKKGDRKEKAVSEEE